MSLNDELKKIPPVTRFLCASSLAVSVPVMLGLVSPYTVLFAPQYVLQRFEVSAPGVTRAVCAGSLMVLPA